MQLKQGTLLQGGKYRIEKVLGQGGFGITYLAIQTGLDRNVAVKEFFMKELCERDESTSHVTLGTQGSKETVNRFREKFLKEARNIARLNHQNIVRIIDVFEENGTAYYVMEYAANGSLADKVKKEGYLAEPVATRYVMQVAEALGYVHQLKMNHLDVKPSNIMLNEKDEIVLIDFGLSKQYDVATGSQTSSTPVGISEGYAPMEQYMQGGVCTFSPETDIYALGATFYKLLTGVTPPNASLVNNEGLPTDVLRSRGISQKAIDIIFKAMEGRKKDRMRTVGEFVECLRSKSVETFISETVIEDIEKTAVDADKIHHNHSPHHVQGKMAPITKKEEHKRKKTTLRTVKSTDGRTEKQQKRRMQKRGFWMMCAGAAVALVAICAVAYWQFPDTPEEIEDTPKEITGTEVTYDANNNSLVFGTNQYKMVYVKGGTFKMGSRSKVYDNELPDHDVTLSDYYIGQTEVTQALWKAVMGSNPSYFEGDNLPVESVSWDECQEFIKKLNARTGRTFRLPTEAEWEYAARGGNKSKGYKYSGSNNPDNVAWYNDNSGSKTHPVKTKSPNELGIYDMSGNVWEWCQDWYGSYGSGAVTNPTGATSGSFRVGRGSSWYVSASYCRSAYRNDFTPAYRSSRIGFRIALSPSR